MSWTAEEDATLDAHHPGPGAWTDDLLTMLPGHNKLSIQRRATELGLTRPKQSSDEVWSDSENAVIYDQYPHRGTACLDHLPGRTRKAIKLQAARLEVRYVGPGAHL